MKTKRNGVYSLYSQGGLLLVSLILLASCGSLAPLKEQAKASDTLERARAVEANVYSEAAFLTAETAYTQGEKLIVTNKKSSDNDKAKEEYLKAISAGNTAYSNSVGPYTKRFLEETDTSLAQARENKVDLASPNLYDEASTLNSEAKDYYTTGEYELAKGSTLYSREVLGEATSETMSLKQQIDEKERLAQLKIEQAANEKALNAVPQEYQAVLKEHENVREGVEAGYYQESLISYDSLIANAEELMVLIDKKRRLAREELLSSEERLELVKERNQELDEELADLRKRDQLETPSE